MKNTKKIAALLITLILVFATFIPVFGYTTDGTNYKADDWTVTEVFHWVVRGDTLEGIADKYGTTVDWIKYYNQPYFNDLALRNQTTGLNIAVENGVRLKIYDQVTVRHFVRRGDTLESLANGALTNGEFTLRTTVSAIKDENKNWFDNLNALNATMSTSFPLTESDNVFAYYTRLIGGEKVSVDQWTTEGSPLYITVPVQRVLVGVAAQYTFTEYNYLRSNVESSPGLSAFQISLATNYIPSNNVLSGYPVGAVEGLSDVKSFILANPRYVTGIYDKGNMTVAVATTTAAASSLARYDAVNGKPLDDQPDNAVAYFSIKAGVDGAKILSDIAKAYNTTVARIKEMNPKYFAYLGANNVSFERDVWIWVPSK